MKAIVLAILTASFLANISRAEAAVPLAASLQTHNGFLSGIRIKPTTNGLVLPQISSRFLKNWDKGAEASSRSGKGFAIAGLALAVANIGAWLFSPILGIFTTIPFCLAGLSFSIIGLIRGKRKLSSRIKILSMTGLLLNAAMLLAYLLLLVATW